MTDESSPDQQHRENEVAQRRACQAISPRAARYFGTPEECSAFEAWDGPAAATSPRPSDKFEKEDHPFDRGYWLRYDNYPRPGNEEEAEGWDTLDKEFAEEKGDTGLGKERGE